MTQLPNIQQQQEEILTQALQVGYLLEIPTGKYLVAQKDQFLESMKQEISMVNWTYPNQKILTYPAELETLRIAFNSLTLAEQNTYKKTWTSFTKEEQIKRIYEVFPQLNPDHISKPLN